MPRNMSFFLTSKQMRRRQKTVTRRLGWAQLKAGDVLQACVKCQGLKRGERPEKICLVRVVSNTAERLDALLPYGLRRTLVDAQREVVREGFPAMTPAEFVEMFCRHMGCPTSQLVQRIEFEYV